MISFRKITKKDLPIFIRWFEDSEVQTQFLPLKIESVEIFAMSLLDSISDPKYERRIMTNFLGLPLGYYTIRYYPDHGTLSILIDKRYRGRGLGSKAIKTVSKKVLLDSPHLGEIRAFIRTTNVASIVAFYKAGFKNTGLADGHEVPTFRYVYRRS